MTVNTCSERSFRLFNSSRHSSRRIRRSSLSRKYRVKLACNWDSTDESVSRKKIVLQFTFPDNYHVPALRLQLTPDYLVSLLIPGNLRCPEISVGLGHRVELAAIVAMPEAAMDEDDSAVLG